MSSGFTPPEIGSGSNYAGVGARMAAHIIDGLLVAAATIPGTIILFVFVIGASAVSGSSESSQNTAGGVAIFGVVLGYGLIFAGVLAVFFYNIFLLGRDGASLGKRWMHVKVLDAAGKPLGFGKALLREMVKGAVGGACVVLYFWPAWDKESQGLQDKVFGTHVYVA